MDELVEMISQNNVMNKLKYVYGIERGGLPIAVHLSHFLNLELCTTHPSGYKKEEILVVDDIAHTGKSLEDYGFWAIATATLFYREESKFRPDFYVRIAKEWIIFPWEREDEIPNRPE
jgi:hypoxanthine phosphoribosyltransferase